jgi:outer membrane protein
MKKAGLASLCLSIILMILLTIPRLASAEKFGFVNLKEALLDSEPGDKMEEDYKKAFERKKVQLQQKEAEMKRLKDDLEKQRSVLKAEAFREKENAFENKVREYQRMVEDANREMDAKKQEMAAKLFPELAKVIESVGEKEGYTAIFSIDNPVVVYRSKGADITKKIIEEFNKKSKAKK